MSLADAGGAAPDPRAHVAAVVGAAGTSFAAGMRLLPRRRREAIFAVYAFARAVDDVADSPGAPRTKHEALDAWEAEIGRVFTGTPATAIGRALAEPAARFDLPREEFLCLLDGMRMDVDGPIVAPEPERLALYVRRVAGSVGMLSMRAFGAWRGAPSARFALALAEALQLINILRDVEEDARLGRLYLPADALARAGLPADPTAAVRHPNLPECLREVGGLARTRLDAARREIGAHPRLRLAPALMMMGPYATALDRIERADWRPGAAVRLGPARKALAGLLCALRPGR